jgi:phosphoribosylformimino-5-aminoimidazole carboxamide ribotide isomerase
MLYNDLDREGTLEGLDLTTGIALADGVSIPVIVGGEIGSIDDVRLLLQPRNALPAPLSGALFTTDVSMPRKPLR